MSYKQQQTLMPGITGYLQQQTSAPNEKFALPQKMGQGTPDLFFMKAMNPFWQHVNNTLSQQNSQQQTNVQPQQQQPTQPVATNSGQNQNQSPGEEGGFLSMLGGVGGIGAIAGLGTQLATNLIGQGKEREIWEKEKQNALAQTLANREGINAMNPEANRRLASMQVQNAMSGAQAGALNAAAGQGQYSGGDVTFAAGAGARNSAMAQQAISPMAQQLAGLYGQKAQEEMGKRQMLDQNSMQQAQIRDMNAYVMDAQNNPFLNLIQAATGGATAFGNIFDIKNKNQKVEGVK